ncbi:peptide ABC transporter ATPase [Devosia geojensis]|uniref:Peptide ABC transporter ATPase n=2 Tax=Devosia geojensis TaxID=443610 RepID=A0A0F5FSH9_9HYPH|nr:peptide ABC transporter ATPase [Devosia geojensis]
MPPTHTEATDMDETIVEVRDLRVDFPVMAGTIEALRGVSFLLKRGKTTCIVGESGSGKSVTARSMMQILQKPGRIASGSIRYRDRDGKITDIATQPAGGRVMRAIRGREIGMVFQEPMTSLSPVHRIGEQIMEPLLLHFRLQRAEARERVLEMMARVGIPNPVQRFDNYPFQLSGGLRQRVVIAMALICEPRLLVADEPTTALDVTTQANILDLIRELQEEMEMSVMFITHDLGVVAEIADDVVVMYAGSVVETADVDTTFHAPEHPYTRALLQSVPRLSADKDLPLAAIRGMVPHPLARPRGCVFHPRCDRYLAGTCDTAEPATIAVLPEHHVKCARVGQDITQGR